MWRGCFPCLQTHETIEAVDWVDDGETPLRPCRGVGAVTIGVTDLMGANSRIKGRRAAIGASEPNKWVEAQESHQAAGGWSK